MRYLLTIAFAFTICGYWAQLPVSVFDCSINDPVVTQAEIDANDDFYKQCILFSTGNSYILDQNDNKQIKARTEIHIQENFQAGDFSSTGKMHLKMESERNLDVFSMNQSNLSAIPQFDKFELGLDLQNEVDQKIQNFFNDDPDPLSPFDPEDINVEADFYSFDNSTGSWSATPVKIFGFYYEEFADTGTDWQNQNTPYDFRIRYTPRIQGKWKACIKIFIEGVETYKANDFIFNVVPSNLKDFTRVGVNKRYFKIGDEPFFPVGQNLPWPGRGTGNYSPVPLVQNDMEEFHLYHDDMEDLADAGANYFRFLINPWSTGIEFEELGHYEDRMKGAWETDRILNHARDLELRIHFNLQVHYPFERVTPTSALHWDWSAYDAQGAYPNCFNHTDDKGYCYSAGLNLLTPEEFLESQNAKRFYKMRLRYIISRWGYSPEISVMELFSEANNIGNHANLSGNGNGCGNLESNFSDPYLGDPYQPARVYAWQNEMCGYIKENLYHTQHPLGVNYTGHPIYEGMSSTDTAGCNMLMGDNSYYSDYTDFWTWNSYSFGPERFEKHVSFNRALNENENHQWWGTPENINKPLMYSEIGITSEECDHDLTWRKMIAMSPFDGSSGGINWMRNNTSTTPANIAERNSLWKTYGYVNDFISGIQLDDDNWFFGYDDRNDDKADVVYLRRRDTQHRAAMGAIQNKTVNFYTNRDWNDQSNECWTNAHRLDTVYKIAKTVQPGSNGNRLEVTSLSKKTDYWIKWYNPFTGQYLPTTSATTNNAGTLVLDFPELGGDGLNSVLLFKAYEVGQPSFSPKIPRNEINKDYLYRDFASYDTLQQTNSAFLTSSESEGQRILVVPNPNNGSFVILFDGDADKLEITNSLSKQVYVLDNPESGQELNLMHLSGGVYLVKIIRNERNSIIKVIIK